MSAGLGAQSALWIDVPFVYQPRDGCGAAAISMVMSYWAAHRGPDTSSVSDVRLIQQQLFSPKKHGITAAAMEQYFREHGFEAFAFSGRWDDLGQQIGKGRPLIVALRPAGQTQLHYVVIDGVDSVHSLVMMNDPAERKLLRQERAEFEKDWSTTHNWVLLAAPASPASSR